MNGVFFDQLIDFNAVTINSFDQVSRKMRDLRSDLFNFPKKLQDGLGLRFLHLHLIKDLNRDFSGFATISHQSWGDTALPKPHLTSTDSPFLSEGNPPLVTFVL